VKLDLTEMEALIVLRYRKGWTQEKAAKLISKELGEKVAVWTLRRWEQNTYPPDKDRLAGIKRFVQKHLAA
jgi:transcriptional regulator with XRE-family HTH domain